MHSFFVPIAWALSSVFAAAAAVQLAGPGFVQRAYERWGFPPRFYRVIGLIELLTAAFLADSITRIWGVALAGLITFGAVVILLDHRQYVYTLPGLLLMAALIPAALAGPF